MRDTIPIIVVTPEFQRLADTMDFTSMSEDEFIEWLLSHASLECDRDTLGDFISSESGDDQ